jgi:haloacetate dehalogenase
MTGTFIHKKIKIEDYTIDLEMGGNGPALLLLHGFPETRFAWHKMASQLASIYTVVMPDLPGYGDSTGPVPDTTYENYSKRRMGTILAALMKELGFESFGLAGHDRGGRVAYRMALDHPTEISRLAVLNILPTLEMAERINYDIAMQMENWFFLSQPSPVPETLIGANPAFYLNHILDSWAASPGTISARAKEIYLRSFKKPEVIAGMCAEYRASLIDIANDRKDRINKRRIQCPVLVLWAGNDILGLKDPELIWKNWADHVSGASLPGGHFLMEECPSEVLRHFLNFF